MLISNPLLNQTFLKKLYSYRQRELFARITALTLTEQPIETIEGRVTQGSINVDGNSSMRRTCSLTLVAQEVNIHNYYWGLNTKFKLEIGIKLPDDIRNEGYWSDDATQYIMPYIDYPEIIWFPMGLYLFTSFSIAYSTNSYTISIQGKDKMCLLNGNIGGSLFASTVFDNEEYYDVDNDETVINKLPIKYIIQEAVHEYAGEPFSNIIVNDLDDLGLELLRYNGMEPLYLFISAGDGDTDQVVYITPNSAMSVLAKTEVGGFEWITLSDMSEDIDAPYKLDLRTQWRQGYEVDVTSYQPTIVYNEDDNERIQPFTVSRVEYGQTCGYRTTDIIYAGDLIGNVGETLTNILDKIVNMLGEFEYFYDLDGHFVFQKKMNFIDHKFNPIVSSEHGSDDLYMEKEAYVENFTYASSHTWEFKGNELIVSLTNAPDLSNIKNDFSLWGERKTTSGAVIPIHMRYGIGKKPTYYKTYEGVTFLTQNEYDLWESRANSNIDTNQIQIHHVLNENGINNTEWWELDDWMKLYAMCAMIKQGYTIEQLQCKTEDDLVPYYPNEPLKNYITDRSGLPTVRRLVNETGLIPIDENVSLPLNRIQIITVGGDATGSFYEDFVLVPGGFGDYGQDCEYTYDWFIGLQEASGGQIQTFIYAPDFLGFSNRELYNILQDFNNTPEAEQIEHITDFCICDWREIIYQMAKDYRQHNHDDDFYIKIRLNNGKDINGEWRYLTGITSYEPFYIDLEGFWRQLYCPRFGKDLSDVARDDNDLLQVMIKDKELYFLTNSDTQGDKISLNNLYKTAIVHATKQIVDNEVENIDKYLIITAKYDIHNNYTLGFTEIILNDGYTELGWNKTAITSPETLNFWFDMWDNNTDWANRYGIQTIGDRPKAVNDNMIKAIYFREIPTMLLTTDIQTQPRKSGYVYMQIPDEYNNLFVISSQGKSAQDVLDEYLFKYSYCTEVISFNALPIYHLEPNTRIYIQDEHSNINGEYIINKITYPLVYSGTMSVSAIKTIERIY